MNRKNKLVIAIIIVLLVSGCVSAPIMLGITEEEWAGYSRDKQNKLLTNYEEITSKHERYASMLEEEPNTTKNTFLEVSIHSGRVMMPPFKSWQYYKPVKFILFKNRCCTIVLQQASNEKVETNLEACYQDDVLYLDPSRHDLTKKRGSISINYSPLWVSGFTYKGVSSSGYVRLNKVTIKIKQKDEA